MDFRILDEENKSKVIEIIKKLEPEQQRKIIIIKG
jgi:hypothetical protein